MFPDKFIKLNESLNKFGSIVFSKEESQDGENLSFSIPALLALCGWRAINKNDENFTLECSSCLRKIDSKFIAC
jgi:hypothetical protein